VEFVLGTMSHLTFNKSSLTHPQCLTVPTRRLGLSTRYPAHPELPSPSPPIPCPLLTVPSSNLSAGLAFTTGVRLPLENELARYYDLNSANDVLPAR
jgi:hypothetical protein